MGHPKIWYFSELFGLAGADWYRVVLGTLGFLWFIVKNHIYLYCASII
jgi:hypothetical protein